MHIKTDTTATPEKLCRRLPVVVVEYRTGGDEEKITWRDKQTGAATTGVIRKFNCETTDGPVGITLPRDCDDSMSLGLKTPLTRGALYLVALTSWTTNKGNTDARGFFLRELPPVK